MEKDRAQSILSVYRPGDQDEADLFFAEAKAELARNPELARWFEEEHAFDRAISEKLADLGVPLGLKTRILASARPVATRQWSWTARLSLAAAALILLAQIIGLWHTQSQKTRTLAHYQQEMVSFIKLDPPLEVESHDLAKMQTWLGQENAPSQMNLPPRLAALQPVGCRVLWFRDHKVTLLCFQRGGDNLAHLFVIDRAALPKLKPGAKPAFAGEGEWMTASWATEDHAYMLVTRGDHDTLLRYLNDT
jgi:anti-sigma factor RsiW